MLSDITVTVDTVPYVFQPAEVSGKRSVRLDTEHGSLALPMSMVQSSETATSSKAGRHLIQFNIVKQDAVTGEVATATAHTVLTVPRSSAISNEDIVLAYELLRTYLTPEVAADIANGILQ